MVIKASTPEIMKDEIVKWLNSQANNCNTASRIAAKKTTQKNQRLKAETYEDAARFLDSCTIDRN